MEADWPGRETARRSIAIRSDGVDGIVHLTTGNTEYQIGERLDKRPYPFKVNPSGAESGGANQILARREYSLTPWLQPGGGSRIEHTTVSTVSAPEQMKAVGNGSLTRACCLHRAEATVLMRVSKS
jgi:hypothetical protein